MGRRPLRPRRQGLSSARGGQPEAPRVASRPPAGGCAGPARRQAGVAALLPRQPWRLGHPQRARLPLPPRRPRGGGVGERARAPAPGAVARLARRTRRREGPPQVRRRHRPRRVQERRGRRRLGDRAGPLPRRVPRRCQLHTRPRTARGSTERADLGRQWRLAVLGQATRLGRGERGGRGLSGAWCATTSSTGRRRAARGAVRRRGAAGRGRGVPGARDGPEERARRRARAGDGPPLRDAGRVRGGERCRARARRPRPAAAAHALRRQARRARGPRRPPGRRRRAARDRPRARRRRKTHSPGGGRQPARESARAWFAQLATVGSREALFAAILEP